MFFVSKLSLDLHDELSLDLHDDSCSSLISQLAYQAVIIVQVRFCVQQLSVPSRYATLHYAQYLRNATANWRRNEEEKS
jgi:hypothetical protein